MNEAKPFLRWAGGKNWLVNKIESYLPKDFNDYHEPFLGGGSVFFHLRSKGLVQNDGFLSDLNNDLAETYSIIKNNPSEVTAKLFEYKNEKDFYYHMRSSNFVDPIEKASRFLFLNRTSFNGIYRVNQKGEYNVPFGNRKLAKSFDIENLMMASEMLNGIHIRCFDFYQTLENVKRGDFIFLDPPYTVAHENNGFVKYNQNIFSWNDQVRLNDFIMKIKEIGAYFIMTNAAHYSIIDLYKNIGNYDVINRPSLIGGKGAKRTTYNELIFSNIAHEQ